MSAKNAIFATHPTTLGEPRAKQSQDDKPLPQQRLVRTTSVNDDPWSHPSLRSRLGMELSQTWPLLTGLFPVQLFPARPFGLGLRFKETPSGNAIRLAAMLPRQSFKPTHESKRSVAQNVNIVK